MLNLKLISYSYNIKQPGNHLSMISTIMSNLYKKLYLIFTFENYF